MTQPSAVSIEETNAFFKEVFATRSGEPPKVTLMERDRAIIRLEAGPDNIRPGNYINGPTQMALADQAAYVAVFTRIGIVPMAVTSSLNINFMRPCIGKAVVAEAKILKLGKTLAVMDVEIRAEGSDKVSAQASVTYALPQG